MEDRQENSRVRESRALIWDVARKSGVSISTVSRVLNGRPDVSVATRDKVLAHVRDLGYNSHRHTHTIVRAPLQRVGVSIPNEEHFMGMLHGITDALNKQKAQLSFCSRSSCGPERTLLERLQADGADAALLVLPKESDEELLELCHAGFPFVVIDPRTPLSDDIPTVTAANIGGARAATKHLLSLGHRRIGLLVGDARWCMSIDRLAGYQAVMFATGLPHDPALIRESDFTLEGGYQAAMELLSLPERPTAIFAFSDDMAVGVLHAALELGLSVPRDLSVVGFDDARFASFVTPALTTVHQPRYELGYTGVDVLFRNRAEARLDAIHTSLSTRLVVRHSTGPCPESF
ncbi:LacI family DNA-binding transcriptional regulator [Dictyobacter aurantiacus]|uniref:LacI family transcriptional regulator n=1 Tax=Dictyobacter aurantiacus TaxID=1936993 RepID=A0A401ZPD5_9CHLR|nr:LacI family DNA-binding transcriptional regulator [Dictyobacter aurantiacus]GCE08616.1 LacI family transcriptional regulator [Dictyobacter aurantiacus]